MLAALGRRNLPWSGEWALRPDVPGPEQSTTREMLPHMIGTIVDRLEMRLADVLALRGPRRRPGQRPLLDVGAASPRPRGDRGDAGDRRRLRAVRHRPGAGPARVEQQPRQHTPFRARPSDRVGPCRRTRARRARRVRPRARASLGGGWHAARDREPVLDRARDDARARPHDRSSARHDGSATAPRDHGPVPGGLPRRAPRAVRGDCRARLHRPLVGGVRQLRRVHAARPRRGVDADPAARHRDRPGVHARAATLAQSVAAMCSAAPGRFALGIGTSSTSSSRTGTASRSRSPTSVSATRSGSCASHWPARRSPPTTRRSR